MKKVSEDNDFGLPRIQAINFKGLYSRKVITLKDYIPVKSGICT